MGLYRVIKDFDGLVSGDNILIGSAHFFVVRLGNASQPTIYRRDLHRDLHLWRNRHELRPLTYDEVVQILPHITWRIWVSDVVHVVIKRHGGSFDEAIRKNLRGEKPRLLPKMMCYECMKEGNLFLPHRPSARGIGICKVCCKEKPLHFTQYAWPLDLSKHGFGLTVGPYNMPANKSYYENNFLIENWD